MLLVVDMLDALDVGRYSSLTSQGDVFAKPLGASNPKDLFRAVGLGF